MSSPGIVTYPLGGITYDAEDAAAYFSTRTSGVFSTEEDFAVTVAESGGTAVTVSPGRAWMHPSRFTGQSVTLREAQTVALPQADSYLPRIDRLVLRFDATARTTTLTVLQGTAQTGPTPPDISRTEMVYDLCLCQLTRPAGQTALTTGGWAVCTDVPGYGYRRTAELRAARAANVPSAVPTPETFRTAVTAGLAGVCETADGSITFWAENVPTGDIRMQVSLLGQANEDTPVSTTSVLGRAVLGRLTLNTGGNA